MYLAKSAALLFGTLLMTGMSAFSQKPNVPNGPAPRLADGKPDLNGVWQRPYVPDITKNGPGQQGVPELSFTPWGEENWKSYDPAKNGDYTGSCLPFGLLRSINSPHAMQIVQSAKYVALLFEQNTWFHVIPIDGREHPKDLDPTWFGNSVGKWDGDKLVVDTIGFNGQTRLDTVGHPHSDATAPSSHQIRPQKSGKTDPGGAESDGKLPATA